MNSKFSRWLLAAASAALLAPTAVIAASDVEAAAGRSLLKKNSDAIVGIELVAVTTGGGRGGSAPRETKREVSGTVISSTGMTITSLATIDPTAGSGGRGSGADVPETQFKEVKLRMADNSEVPATVVLKDAELDLAFIAPTGEGAVHPFSFVNLADAAEPQVLGTYFEVGRMPKNLQRVPVVNTITVVGTIDKPRKLFLLEDNATLGIPVFDVAGKVIGVGLVYFSNGTATRGVIIPAADIADMAKQASTARDNASGLPMALPPAK